jgi:hypothetical protein
MRIKTGPITVIENSTKACSGVEVKIKMCSKGANAKIIAYQ